MCSKKQSRTPWRWHRQTPKRFGVKKWLAYKQACINCSLIKSTMRWCVLCWPNLCPVQGRPETCGRAGQPNNSGPFKPIFFKRFRPKTGLTNFFEVACPNCGYTFFFSYQHTWVYGHHTFMSLFQRRLRVPSAHRAHRLVRPLSSDEES
jgi:hypothetical protein